jgi:hypothetical protein
MNVTPLQGFIVFSDPAPPVPTGSEWLSPPLKAPKERDTVAMV